MRTPLIVGNWKMNTTRGDAHALATACAELAASHRSVEVGIAPPAIWLESLVAAHTASPLRVFGQNVGEVESGARTGEIAPTMLREAGASGTLIGHSERRTLQGETDALIATKVELATSLGLHVILCVGETLDEREAEQTFEVVERQLTVALAGVDSLDRIDIAYEPVWAIGTGRTATPDQAQDVHARIRALLADRFDAEAAASTRIQYGGSVKPANAADLLAMPDIDGALVGGASLKADSFAAIIEAAGA